MKLRKKLFLVMSSFLAIPTIFTVATSCNVSKIEKPKTEEKTTQVNKTKTDTELREEYFKILKNYNEKLSSLAKKHQDIYKEINGLDKKHDKKSLEYRSALSAQKDLLFSIYAEYQNNLKPLVQNLNSLNKQIRDSEKKSHLKSVKIFHTNDEHGRLKTDTGRFNNYAGFEGLSEFLNDRNRDLLISAGDLIQGLPLSDFDKGETISKIVKHLKYDLVTIGNHEFDFGLEHIKKLNEYNSKLDNGKASPFLSANIYYKDYKDQVAPKNYDQSKVGQRVFKPYLIKTLENDLKVAIIAITTPDTAYTSSPKNSVLVEFRDPVTEAKKVVAEIKEKENVDLIIASTHLGIGRDKVEWDSSTLMSKVEDIDLLIDGHSHTYVPIKNQKYVYDKRYLTQTEAYTKYIGEVDIVFDTKTKKISRIEQSLRNINEILVANSNYTSEAIRLLEDLFNIENNIELFTSEQSFRHTEDVVIGGTTYISGRTKATPLGVLWANSLAHGATLTKFWEANSTNENLAAATLDNHIALVNGGGLRVDLKTGKIKKGNLVAIAPFGNRPVTLKVNGKTLKEAITHGLQKGQTGGFSQLSSNVSYEAVVEKTTLSGSEKYEYKVKKIQINGKDIDENQIYYITTNDFIAIGGDDYQMLNLDNPKNKNKVVKVLELNSQVEIFTSYFEKYQNPSEEAKKELFGYQVNEVNKPEFLAKQKIIFPVK